MTYTDFKPGWARRGETPPDDELLMIGPGRRFKRIWYSVLDIELTLNRFGFAKLAENKFQIACFRIAWWRIPGKKAISFEINWRAYD